MKYNIMHLFTRLIIYSLSVFSESCSNIPSRLELSNKLLSLEFASFILQTRYGLDLTLVRDIFSIRRKKLMLLCMWYAASA